jgi:hypothetical protein
MVAVWEMNLMMRIATKVNSLTRNTISFDVQSSLVVKEGQTEAKPLYRLWSVTLQRYLSLWTDWPSKSILFCLEVIENQHRYACSMISRQSVSPVFCLPQCGIGCSECVLTVIYFHSCSESSTECWSAVYRQLD